MVVLWQTSSSSGEISLGELSDGEYSIEFTLHSSGSGLPQWDPLVQTTLIFNWPVDVQMKYEYDSEAVAHVILVFIRLFIMIAMMFAPDIDNDLICDELEILGCQDSLALNYDSTATDAGGCDYLVVLIVFTLNLIKC